MVQLAQNLIGQSPAWLVTLDALSGLAAIDKPVLVVGEAGTGKTSIAARMHFLSPHWEQTWQAINCAAMSGANLETRLFGSSSPTTGHIDGLLESADGGTLFLDNIDAMPLCLQERLLGVMETGTYQETNSDAQTSVDVRTISASSINLREEVAVGRFNAGLLSVLAYDVITLPPLRARQRDILPLAEKFAKDMVADLGEESFGGFSAEVSEFLKSHDWPDNVRGLKSVIERAVGRAWNEDSGLGVPISQINIDPFEAPWKLRGALTGIERGIERHQFKTPRALNDERQLGESRQNTPPREQPTALPTNTNFTERTDAFELAILTEALTHTKNHQGKAAKYLGLTYHQFRGLLRKHGLKK